MTDLERLKRSGYGLAGVGIDSYLNEYAIFFKQTRHHRIFIYVFGDRSTFIVLDGVEKRGDIVDNTKKAIAYGEKWLAEKAAERKAKKATKEVSNVP